MHFFLSNDLFWVQQMKMEYIAKKQSDSLCIRWVKSDESLKVCYKPQKPKKDASIKGKKTNYM